MTTDSDTRHPRINASDRTRREEAWSGRRAPSELAARRGVLLITVAGMVLAAVIVLATTLAAGWQ